MANSKEAIEFVMKQEDSTLSGEVTTDAGGRTRFGIAERFHSDLTSTGYYDEMEGLAALSVAEEIYQKSYWVEVCGDQIENQDVANRVLSFAVNLGSKQAIVLLQRAANTLGAGLHEDGAMGTLTLKAVNLVRANHNWRRATTLFRQTK